MALVATTNLLTSLTDPVTAASLGDCAPQQEKVAAVRRLIQNDSNAYWGADLNRDRDSLTNRVHTSLNDRDFARLNALVKQQRSSVAQIVRVALAEYLDRDTPQAAHSENC